MTPTLILCTQPRCGDPRLGMVDGRWWPLCYDHAFAYATDALARALAEHDALTGLGQRRGQLTLVSSS